MQIAAVQGVHLADFWHYSETRHIPSEVSAKTSPKTCAEIAKANPVHELFDMASSALMITQTSEKETKQWEVARSGPAGKRCPYWEGRSQLSKITKGKGNTHMAVDKRCVKVNLGEQRSKLMKQHRIDPLRLSR